MKKLLVASAVVALFAAGPVIAAENTPTGTGKPSSSAQPTPPAEGQMGKDTGSMNTDANGTSTGATGMSKDMPGSSDSKKKDSSLSTNGSAPKQQ